MELSGSERRLVAALQRGLPLSPSPYREIGRGLGMGEDEVIAAIARWREEGRLKRLGVIVRHHELGYSANAMVVWDVPDAAVAEVGRRFAEVDYVTLCYRRTRRPPHWPYNLFTMVHGRERAAVLSQVETLARVGGVADAPRSVLFSRRRFKQVGAIHALEAVPEALP